MSLLDQITLLTHQDSKTRLDATIKIFELLDLQSFSPQSVDSTDALKTKYSTDIQYTFSRLIRGLSSSRDQARRGFSNCLAELLRALPKIDISFVIKQVENATQTPGSLSKQETRDCRFGRLFGFQAIVNSGLLDRKKTTIEEIREMVGILFEMSVEKGWLRESCAHVIIEILEIVESGAKPDKDGKTSKTKTKLCKETAKAVHELLYDINLSKTIEGIVIALKCIELGSKNKRAAAEWGSNILGANNFDTIMTIMRDGEASDDGPGNRSGTGTWKPKMHFAWIRIVNLIRASESSDTIPFNKFWNQCVCKNLLGEKSSAERKFHGLQLLGEVLPVVSSDQYKDLFSEAVLAVLASQSSKDDRYLHKAAKGILTLVQKIAEEDTTKALPLVEAFINEQRETMFFDRSSKTKTVTSLIELIPEKELPSLIKYLLDRCVSADGANGLSSYASRVDLRRPFIADTLVNMIKNPRINKNSKWIDQVLQYFMVSGFFSGAPANGASYSDFSELSRKLSRDKIVICLGHLIHQEDGVSYAKKVIRMLKTYTDNDNYTLVFEPDDKIKDIINSSMSNFKALTKSGTHEPGFILLYALSILQVYAGDADSVELLTDLEQSYQSMASGASSSEEIQLLIDTLLAFLSKDSAVVRKLVENVFGKFAEKLDRNSLTLLMNVLDAPESGDGIFDQANNEVETDDEEEVEEESEPESSDEEEEEEDDNEEPTEADKALEEALVQALGTKRTNDEMDDDSESEDLLDDDAMMKMDDALSNIFKRRKQESAGSRKQDAQAQTRSTLQLKSRILDLLDIFIKTCPESPLTIELLVPLLDLSNSTKDKQLAEKAQTLVRQKLTKPKTAPVWTEADVAMILTILESVHAHALKSKTNSQAATCSSASMYLVRQAMTTNKESIADICKVYTSTQIAWMQKRRACLSASFFSDFIGWSNVWRMNSKK